MVHGVRIHIGALEINKDREVSAILSWIATWVTGVPKYMHIQGGLLVIIARGGPKLCSYICCRFGNIIF